MRERHVNKIRLFLLGPLELAMCKFTYRKQFGLLVSIEGAMTNSAMDALNRAATRAQRRADLEVAKMLVERHLGYEIGETQFGWLSLLSMPQQYGQISTSYN